jgi:hypothetical protein
VVTHYYKGVFRNFQGCLCLAKLCAKMCSDKKFLKLGMTWAAKHCSVLLSNGLGNLVPRLFPLRAKEPGYEVAVSAFFAV